MGHDRFKIPTLVFAAVLDVEDDDTIQKCQPCYLVALDQIDDPSDKKLIHDYETHGYWVLLTKLEKWIFTKVVKVMQDIKRYDTKMMERQDIYLSRNIFWGALPDWRLFVNAFSILGVTFHVSLLNHVCAAFLHYNSVWIKKNK
ncbi:hypothetical protein ACJX0J_026484, partial [Zea mays]